MKKFWKEFFKKLCKKLIFFLKNNYIENSLICPIKDKSENHCPTELFPIYPDNHWTIRRRDNHIVVPSSNRIKLKIDWFLVSLINWPDRKLVNLTSLHWAGWISIWNKKQMKLFPSKRWISKELLGLLLSGDFMDFDFLHFEFFHVQYIHYC